MSRSDDRFPLKKLFKKGWYWFNSKTVYKVQSCLNDRKAASALTQWKKTQRHDGTIKCCFIVQMPELWNKQQKVYQKMTSDKRFEVWLLIVPQYRIDLGKLDDYGSEREYFEAECRNGNVLYAVGDKNSSEIDISRFDYVFYQRPYDWYLPEELKSNNVAGKAGICYIPYATPEMRKTVIYPQSFFRNIYIGFMEDEYASEFNTKRFKKTCSTGIQHFLNVGYPPFEACLALKEECLYKNVLWTPRWSYDPVVGGSHFVEYVDQLLEYDFGDAELCVRPHPMMWQEFIRTGKMTQKQIDDIFIAWEKHGITQDSNKDIIETFRKTDILISDNSSIIPMFFMTGKPVIYCEFAIDFGSLFRTVMPGMYIARNWQDVKKYLDQLLAHEDPLLNVRKEIINKHFNMHDHAADHIIKTIMDDYYQAEMEK